MHVHQETRVSAITRLGLLGATFLMALPVLVYGLLAPLFVGSWFVDLFGDVSAQNLFPIVSGVVILLGTTSLGRSRQAIPARRATVLLLVGGILIVIGAQLFGGVWEILQAEHRFAASQTYGSFRPMCADFLPACLIRERHQYPSQALPSLAAGVVWYMGLFLWWRGSDARYWQSDSSSNPIAFVRDLLSADR
ncbi:MAG: hypothetical protein SVG88_07080 [Halobacteriales archaeon]|nr:hypothetical protein [Halobacteriales archaeon]